MKAITTFLGGLALAVTLTSCEADVVIGNPVVEPTLNEIMESHEIWYLDLNSSQGPLDVPFMTRAFTLSFDYGTLFANNNIAGIGRAGAGLGIDVGAYDGFGDLLTINHDLDGIHEFRVIVRDFNRLELRDLVSGTRYFLDGYSVNNFDYDRLFYNNIQYFLQEYQTWEKVYTSNEGAINEFDEENFLRFLPGSDADIFQSSKDRNGTNAGNLFYDYEGEYWVEDVTPGSLNKHLTLDYDFIGNDYFDLYVIDDGTIELFHESSGTTYEFKGKGRIVIKNNTGSKSRLLDVNRSREKKK
ncbi:nicotinic acid mononucleotide adenyltransferase [Nonlabens ponticola]|uniref:Nicotinic acid mononucleotide adenyltransferase n=1 Tax=Nonlabens ponticola TaxID=2496866 RepID=A0A3S9MW39_9FLAO|nr:nicotinic acid mononucleotide adenyltransferase [Nonlabens ponticola]AZQ43347.1 nicotinic acid mononucleotide adenyltransferase [Nonlabens ponticola]